MVVIIGGGPSLAKTNLDLVKDKYVIGTNFAFTLGNWVNAMIFADCRMYESWGYQDLIDSFPGRKYTMCERIKDDPNFIYYKKCQKFFTLENGKLGWNTSNGPNTGSAAINLAIQLGYKKIVLVGYDGKVSNEKKHNFHSYHKHVPNDIIYLKFQKHFKGLYEAVQEKCPDVEIINATPGTKIDVFPKAKLEDVV